MGSVFKGLPISPLLITLTLFLPGGHSLFSFSEKKCQRHLGGCHKDEDFNYYLFFFLQTLESVVYL